MRIGGRRSERHLVTRRLYLLVHPVLRGLDTLFYIRRNARKSPLCFLGFLTAEISVGQLQRDSQATIIGRLQCPQFRPRLNEPTRERVSPSEPVSDCVFLRRLILG